jgi:hypothetical protein
MGPSGEEGAGVVGIRVDMIWYSMLSSTLTKCEGFQRGTETGTGIVRTEFLTFVVAIVPVDVVVAYRVRLFGLISPLL